MIISAPYVAGEQDLLPWDDDTIDRPAATRQLVGEFFEQATVAITGGMRHQINGRADICPDISVGQNRFIECKAVVLGTQAIVFEHRLARDRQMLDQTGGSLAYCWWSHQCRATACTSRRQLWGELAVATRGAYVVPFQKLEAECRRRRPTLTLERGGKVLHGFRIPFSVIRRLAGEHSRWSTPTRQFSTVRLGPVPVYGTAGELLPDLTPEQRFAASEMLRQLRHQGLDVVLAAAPRASHRGHCVRVVQDTNPGWYRQLCLTTTAGRRQPRQRQLHDTGIKRANIVAALTRLSSGRRPYWRHEFLVLPYVQALAADWGTYGD